MMVRCKIQYTGGFDKTVFCEKLHMYHIQHRAYTISISKSNYRLNKSKTFQHLIELSSVGIINNIKMKIEVTHCDQIPFGDSTVLKKLWKFVKKQSSSEFVFEFRVEPS